MKKLTILFSILLVLAFIGTMIYVAAAPDFAPPADLAGEGEDPDAPVWKMTVDDLVNYLADKGLIDPSTKQTLTEGVATLAFEYSNVEIYWWDLENISKDSDEYAAYEGMRDNGMVDLWGMGQYFMPLTKNGPFGIYTASYEGDVKALLAAYEEFGK